MSVMGSDEVPLTYEERLQAALVAFSGCIGEALDDLCSYSLTIGETYVPFDPDEGDDCDDEDGSCDQAWVRVAAINPISTPDMSGSGCAVDLEIDLEVGVLRCLEVPEGGEAPTASDVLAAALQSMTDMKKMQCAALGCEVWESIDIGTWTPSGPLGGQYGGIWTFTVSL